MNSKAHPTPKFKRGAKVRVRYGVKDADYPDIPLGGWAGEIGEVHDDGMYTVFWSAETSALIHPVCKARCEKHGPPEKIKVIGLGNPDD